MTGLPDTRTTERRGGTGRHWLPALVAIAMLALLAGLWPGGGAPVPPGEIRSGTIEDVIVGAGGTPGEDGSRFEAGTRAVDVHVRVGDLPQGRRLYATVERTGRSSVPGLLFGTGRIRAQGGAEDRLSVFGGGASGVISFEVRPAGGGKLPAGAYAVEIRDASAGDRVMARTHFRIGPWRGFFR